mmetsp:Transcript_3310/g.8339  ORF Transcript_3310/g.8339 Transcript_3310/m.8339 type:complete len:131 (-) Transcript_3310:440-832(-)|eukprot:jgi/Tetstr1/448191/TSEL_035482.t1
MSTSRRNAGTRAAGLLLAAALLAALACVAYAAELELHSDPPSKQHAAQRAVPALPLCELAMETGPCRAAIRRWHFDTATNTCKRFTYGGCRGNENNFETEEECMETCNPHQLRTSRMGTKHWDRGARSLL